MNDKAFDRTKGLGGSDIPALLGVSPFKNPLELYLEKTGGIKPDDVLLTDKRKALFAMGNLLEPYVLQNYQDRYGGKITRRQERIYHPDYPFLWGTIDGMQEGLVVEVKTTASYVANWQNSIPIHVLVQVAYYCNLLNSTGAKIIAMFRDTGEIITHHYDRDLTAEKHIISEAVKFWQETVQKNQPPAPTSYPESQLLFRRVEPQKKVIATQEAKDILREMVLLRREMTEKEKAYDALKTKICAFFKDAPILEDENGTCLATWNSRAYTSILREKLKQEYPEAYQDCLSQNTTRNLLIKKIGETNNE